MKTIRTIIISLFVTANIIFAQDTLYVYKAGAVAYKSVVNSIDSITFYKKQSTTPIPTTVTDVDGNIYHTITIGTQTWLVENLKTTKYNDGTSISYVTEQTAWANLTIGAYCWYNNDATSYKNTYGALYNWYAVNTGKLAPIGWHVPTSAEMYILTNYLSSNVGYSITVTKAMASKSNWKTSTTTNAIGNNPSLNNSSGFTAQPGGWRNDNGFYGLSSNSNWWSSSSTASSGLQGFLDYSNQSTYTTWSIKPYGLSVRCVMD